MHGPYTTADKRVYVLGLYVCPVTQDNPTKCQMNCVRCNCNSFKDWIDYVNGLPDDEIEKIYNEHHSCIRDKDAVTLYHPKKD